MFEHRKKNLQQYRLCHLKTTHSKHENVILECFLFGKTKKQYKSLSIQWFDWEQQTKMVKNTLTMYVKWNITRTQKKWGVNDRSDSEYIISMMEDVAYYIKISYHSRKMCPFFILHYLTLMCVLSRFQMRFCVHAHVCVCACVRVMRKE